MTEAKPKTYQVTVSPELTVISPETTARRRAGLEIPVGTEGYIGPLSAEQLKEIDEDTYLTVKPHKG